MKIKPKKRILIPGFLLAATASVTFWMRPKYSPKQEKIVYKSIENKNLTADFYQENFSGNLQPLVIVVHGGGWSAKTGDMVPIVEDLVDKGFSVLNVTYRLAPDDLYPAAVEDIQDALIWAQNNSEKLRIQKEQIFMWGYSAGAHLSLMVGLDPKNKIKAIVAGGTPADLTVWPESPIITQFIGAKFKEKPDVWKQASPIFKVKPQSPPVFLYHGQKDDLVEVNQMYRLQKILQANQVKVESYEDPRWGHMGVYLMSQESRRRAVKFLDESL